MPKTVNFMSRMFNGHIFTENREKTTMGNEPKCEQWCYVGDRICGWFSFPCLHFSCSSLLQYIFNEEK